MRVLVIEDEGLLRSTLSAALRSQGLTVCGQADSASLAVRIAAALAPQAVIADIDLGDGPTGLEAVQEIRRTRPEIGVVILTSFDDPRLAGSTRKMLPPNAEYLVKGQVLDAAEVVRAVRRSVAAASGVTPVRQPTSTRTESVLNGVGDSSIAILRMVAEGMTNAQIAEARGIAEGSVEVAITRLARKLGISRNNAGNSRVLLTRIYLAHCGHGGTHVVG